MARRPMKLGDYGSVAYLSRWKSFTAWFRLAAPKGSQIYATSMFVVISLSQVWFGGLDPLVMIKLLGLLAGFSVVALTYKKQRLLRWFERAADGGLRLVVLRRSASGSRYTYLVLKDGETMELNEVGRGLGRHAQGLTEFGLSPSGKVRTLTMDQETWLARTP